MKKSHSIQTSPGLMFLTAAIVMAYAGRVDSEVIAFDSDQWILQDAQVVDHLDQRALQGTAFLKDVEFENGLIEVDMAVDGSRCYPGITFRSLSREDREVFYVRPHQSNRDDALQYASVFNGVTCWQLDSGFGFTANAKIPTDRWFHIKLEVLGDQARVYLEGADRPALIVHDLRHGERKGAVGVYGPSTGQVHFANFSITVNDKVNGTPAPPTESPAGVLTDWEISQAYKVSQLNRELSPEAQKLEGIHWQQVASDPFGLVNVSQYVKRAGREPDCILARTTVPADKNQIKKLIFGYSDEVSVFLNGKILFAGNSAYHSRDPSFLGIMSWEDALFLNLEQGDNELLLMVTDSFGGWGFQCRLVDRNGEAVFEHENMTRKWESTTGLTIPESVVYDPAHEVLYVSNYYNTITGGQPGSEFISKVKLDGEVQELRWVKELTRPTGMCLYKDKLFAVERENLVEIDTDTGEIIARHVVPGSGFVNDAAVDQSGNVYISDSDRSVIYKFSDGECVEWLQSNQIERPNGLCVDNKRLLVGNSGDGCLKAVDLTTKAVTVLVSLGGGSIMDGIQTDKAGNCYVSDWNGRTFLVSPSGHKTELLNTVVPKYNSADIAYIENKNLLVIPTFYNNTLVAYELVVD